MKKTVQYRGGHHLVVGEHLGPVLHRLVRGDEGAPPLISVADQSEEQACLLARHRLEPDLVDDQQRDLQILFPSKPAGSDLGVLLHGVQKVLEADEGARGQSLDPAFLDAWLEGEVEVPKRLTRGKPGEFERSLDAPLLAAGKLHLQKFVQEAVRGEVIYDI